MFVAARAVRVVVAEEAVSIPLARKDTKIARGVLVSGGGVDVSEWGGWLYFIYFLKQR